MNFNLLSHPLVQFGALGLAFFLAVALARAVMALLQQRDQAQRDLMSHHTAREKAFSEQFLACVDRNSAALEKVEQGLHRIHLELARREHSRCLD